MHLEDFLSPFSQASNKRRLGGLFPLNPQFVVYSWEFSTSSQKEAKVLPEERFPEPLTQFLVFPVSFGAASCVRYFLGWEEAHSGNPPED